MVVLTLSADFLNNYLVVLPSKLLVEMLAFPHHSHGVHCFRINSDIISLQSGAFADFLKKKVARESGMKHALIRRERLS